MITIRKLLRGIRTALILVIVFGSVTFCCSTAKHEQQHKIIK